MNNENNLKLVDKYLLVVKRNLLIKDKDEIINNIYDEILYTLDSDHSEENIKAVLESLGNPSLLAMKYQSSDKYLIGPQLYDLYLYTNKISLQISSLVFVIFMFVIMALDIYKDEFILSAFISSTISGYIWMIGQVFLWVTVIFAICQKTLTTDQAREYLQHLSAWDINKLNAVEEENQIKKSEVIGTLISIPIMFLLVYYFRHYNFELNSQTFYVLNQSILPQIFILYGIANIFSFGVQVIILIKGKWTPTFIVLDLISQLFGLGVSYYLIVSLKMFAFLDTPILSQYHDDIYLAIKIGTIITAVIMIFTSLYKLYNIIFKRNTINL